MSDIRTWLEALGLGEHAEAFEAENITPALIGDLDDSDLKDLGLSMGHRKLVLRAVTEPAPTPAAAPREAERRQITVMFCDLVGSTALSEKLDPEDLRALMQSYQKAAGEVIERFGGHVAQYLGDGLMTYFGWPQAHEDDGERAVRASLDIVEAINAMDLQVRIGIATGPVVVGETGAGDASVPKLAVGETPNLAARLQGLAEADEIVVGPSTRRLLGGTFELADMGEQALKGIVEPVQAHRVTGIATTEGRFEAQHQHLTPLVGREAEMAMVIARWEQAKAGEGQVIVLGGEPGIGKSRITQALMERVADEPHTRLRYQCSPYHTNSALHPVVEQLERAAGFQRDDTPDQKLDKLEALIPGALVASLLSLPTDRYPALAMSPQKHKEETLRVLAEQVTALAVEAPVLLIFEDAHWIDPTSHELLDLVVPMVAGHKVLTVITHRPEYEPPWLGQGHVSPLALQRLGKAEAAAMVAQVSVKPLSNDVLDQIVAKTDGVPLFVEELTKTVQESGAETANAIPETLQDSLMARLDRLSPVKEVAQIGACIGREFSHELLAAVAPLNDNELGDALQQLVNSELIHRTGNSYTFKHALVQDSAYESLLKSRRQHIHSVIAQALPVVLPDTEARNPHLLARHHDASGDKMNAAKYWLMAGMQSLANSALAEAEEQLVAGLAATLAQTPSKDRDTQELEVRQMLGTARMALFGWPHSSVTDALEPAYDLCVKLERFDVLPAIVWGIWLSITCRGELNEAELWLERLFERSKQENDGDCHAVAEMAGVCTRFWRGEYEATKTHAKEVMNSYDRSKHGHIVNYTIHDPKVLTHTWAGAYLAWILGYPDEALKENKTMISEAELINHPFNLAFSLTTGACTFAMRRDAAAMREANSRALAVASENGIPFIAGVLVPMWGGMGEYEDGKYEEAERQLSMGVSGWVGAGGRIVGIFAEGYLALCKAKLGKVEEACSDIQTTIDDAEARDENWCLPELYRLRGEIAEIREGSNVDEAIESYEKALEIARSHAAKGWELRAATSLARLWQSQGKAAEGHDLLAPVYDWFTEGFDTLDLIDAKALLHELANG
jgi:class 3 adenylate cyclase/tetratricopeptide (TPR) repeat protein